MKIREAMFILSAFTEGRVFYPDILEFKDWSDKRFKKLEGYGREFQSREEFLEFYKDFSPMDELKEMLRKIVSEEEIAHAIILLSTIVLESPEVCKEFESMTLGELRKRVSKYDRRGMEI